MLELQVRKSSPLIWMAAPMGKSPVWLICWICCVVSRELRVWNWHKGLREGEERNRETQRQLSAHAASGWLVFYWIPRGRHKRDMFNMLVHLPVGCNRQHWTGLRLGAGNILVSPMWVTEGQAHRPIFHCFSQGIGSWIGSRAVEAWICTHVRCRHWFYLLYHNAGLCGF